MKRLVAFSMLATVLASVSAVPEILPWSSQTCRRPAAASGRGRIRRSPRTEPTGARALGTRESDARGDGEKSNVCKDFQSNSELQPTQVRNCAETKGHTLVPDGALSLRFENSTSQEKRTEHVIAEERDLRGLHAPALHLVRAPRVRRTPLRADMRQ